MKRTQSVSTKNYKAVVGRIRPGVDLIQGLQEICNENNIRFGVIATVLGSLSQGCIVYAKPDETNKIGLKYSEPTYFQGPLELLACQGIVGENQSGDFQIHLHGLMGDKDLKIIGGHFLPNENKILATAEVMILEIGEAEFIKKYDEVTGFELFNFYNK